MPTVNDSICNYLVSKPILPWNSQCCDVMRSPPADKCSLASQGAAHCEDGGSAICTYKGGVTVGGGKVGSGTVTKIDKLDTTGSGATYLNVGGGRGDGREQMPMPIGGYLVVLL